VLKLFQLNHAYLPFRVWFVFIRRTTRVLKLPESGRLDSGLYLSVILYHVKILYLKVMQRALFYGECVVLWYRRADFATLGYLH